MIFIYDIQKKKENRDRKQMSHQGVWEEELAAEEIRSGFLELLMVPQWCIHDSMQLSKPIKIYGTQSVL